MNIKSRLLDEIIAEIPTKAGLLSILNLTVKRYMDWEKELGRPVAESSPEETVRKLVKVTCVLADDLKNENEGQESIVTLTDSQLALLTNEELECFSEVFLKDNEYLYREQIEKKEPDDKGHTVFSYEWGEIKYPQKEGEATIAYLHRLLVQHEKEQNERFEKLFGSVNIFKGLPDTLVSSMKSNFALGETILNINKTLGSLNKVGSVYRDHVLGGNAVAKAYCANKSVLDAAKPALSSEKVLLGGAVARLAGEQSAVGKAMKGLREAEKSMTSLAKPIKIKVLNNDEELAKLTAREEERRLAPFDKLGSKLDELISDFKENLEIQKVINGQQITSGRNIAAITALAKTSVDDAKENTKKNIDLTKWVIGISIVGVVVAILSIAVSFYINTRSINDQNRSSEATQEMANTAIKELRAIKDELRAIKEQEAREAQKKREEVAAPNKEEKPQVNKVVHARP